MKSSPRMPPARKSRTGGRHEVGCNMGSPEWRELSGSGITWWRERLTAGGGAGRVPPGGVARREAWMLENWLRNRPDVVTSGVCVNLRVKNQTGLCVGAEDRDLQ